MNCKIYFGDVFWKPTLLILGECKTRSWKAHHNLLGWQDDGGRNTSSNTSFSINLMQTPLCSGPTVLRHGTQ